MKNYYQTKLKSTRSYERDLKERKLEAEANLLKSTRSYERDLEGRGDAHAVREA